MEIPKIQIFCQGRKFQFSNKIFQKFGFCENSIPLFLPGFVLVYIFYWLIKVAASISDSAKKKLLNFDTWL
jgi:hypothetical protein